MFMNKNIFFKIISLSLFHTFKKFKFTKYKGFISKKIGIVILNFFFLKIRFSELDFCKIKGLILNNSLNKIRNFKLTNCLFTSDIRKNIESILNKFLIFNFSNINKKKILKIETLNTIYRFFKKKKKLNKNNFHTKMTSIVNYLNDNPIIFENLKYIKEKNKVYRKDFRNLDIFSIDPLGSLIIEDSLHFKLNKKYSKFELGVHISDITCFLTVQNQSIIKSIEKITTNFLNDRKIDLFSTLSSYNLYSFRQGLDRFSFSLIFNLDHDSNILSLKICKSIIRNKRLLSYIQSVKIFTQSKNYFNKTEKKCFYEKNFRKILEFKKKLRSNRIKTNGKFQTKIQSYVKKFKYCFKNQNNNIIEELMLLFNVSLTEKILEYFPSCFSIQKFSKNIKHIKSSSFKFLLFPKIKIDLIYFKSLYKYAKVLCWKEKIIMNKIYLINNKYFDAFNILNIVNIRNKKILIKFIIGLKFSLYLQFSAPIRRIYDVFSHFFMFFIIEKKLDVLYKYTKPNNIIYLYEKFYLLLTAITKN